MPSTPTKSPREAEEERLRAEADGTLAPAKKGTFHEARREKEIKNQIAEGLKLFDEAQQGTTPNP
jgi:hypothetical protein